MKNFICLVIFFFLVSSCLALDVEKQATRVATFAGGCFWCMEPPFDKVEGVISTTSGYMGGTKDSANYAAVSSGSTEHAEVVQVRYDPSKVSYLELLKIFWQNIDPTVLNRQFCDAGKQYRTAVFFHDDEQKKQALDSKGKIEKSNVFKQLHTQVTKALDFYEAEEYHQDFYKKSPVRYYSYRKGCGRDSRLESLWRKNKEKIW